MALAEAARGFLDPLARSAVEAAGSVDVAVAVHGNRPGAPGPEALEAIAATLAARFTGAVAAILVTDGGGPGWAEIRRGGPEPPRIPLGPAGPGRPGLLTALAAAQGLEARAVAVLDAALAPALAARVPDLLEPVLLGEAEFVAPAYSRSPAEGTLTTNLLAPLTGALYGRRVQQVAGGAAGLSARLLTRCLESVPADAAWLGPGGEGWGLEIWLTTEAVASGAPVVEVHLGRRPAEPAGGQPDLATLVVRTVGPLFALMERHAAVWLEAGTSAPVPRRGDPASLPSPRPPDLDRLVAAFRLGLKDLLPVWEQVMPETTLERLYPLGLLPPEDFDFPPTLWARVVADFAIGHRERRLAREHLLRSLTPLYLGRAAGFLRATRRAPAAAVARAIEHLDQAFDTEKERLVTRWR